MSHALAGKPHLTSDNPSSLSRTRFLRIGGSAITAGLVSASSPVDATTPSIARSNPFRPAPSRATLTIDRSRISGAVAPMLAGLAYEKSVISTPCLTSASTALLACFKLLGPSILRLGGHSTDATTWVPNGNGGTAGQVTKSDIDQLAEFVRQSGWRIIYGINFAKNTPANAAAEAAYATRALGASLFAIEIGNEPDGYAQNGLRPSTYTLTQFVKEWSAFASAIRQRIPNVSLSGPAAGYQVEAWTKRFAEVEGSEIQLLTQHYYMGAGHNPTPTITEMLAEAATMSTTLAVLRSSVVENHISGGFRLTEANSFFDGGAAGVSNAFASALWTVDFLMTCASYGAAGVNLQGGCDGSYAPYYTPIVDYHGTVTSIRPVFYGMLLVSRIAPGPMHPVVINSDAKISAYAIAGNDGATNVVVVNKSPQQAVNLSIVLNAPAAHAEALSLHGPALNSLQGTTLGGAPVTLLGNWDPQDQPAIEQYGSILDIQIPAGAAKLIRTR